jgi:hypothetical protein
MISLEKNSILFFSTCDCLNFEIFLKRNTNIEKIIALNNVKKYENFEKIISLKNQEKIPFL